MPALQSFCIYAATGIFVIYLTMVSFFYAFFSLDQRRIEAVRNGIICCYKHKTYKPNECSQKSILEMIFVKFSGLLIKLPTKIVILVMTVTFLCVGCFGLVKLKTEFKFEWFLEEGTYLRTFFDVSSERYEAGFNGAIWVAENPKLYQKINEINTLVEK